MACLVLCVLLATPAQNAAADNAIAGKTRLSAPQIQRLSNFMVKFGLDAKLSSKVTMALGLTRDGEDLPIRQINVPLGVKVTGRPGAENLAHAYHVTSDGGWLLVTGSTVSARSYRADAKQELVAAVDTRADAAPVAIPVATAQMELDTEFAYWAAVADTF